MSKKRLTLELVLEFEGDYYDAFELEGVASDWIGAGLEDRDDLKGWRVEKSVVEAQI